MNKVFVKGIFATAVAAMALTSCSSDITEDVTGSVGEIKHVTFKAKSETPAGTRTSIDGLSIKWNAGDHLTVWPLTAEESAQFEVTETTSDETSAVIEGMINSDQQYVAVYPEVSNPSTTKNYNGEISIHNITVPQEQEANSSYNDSEWCDKNATLMVAVSDVSENELLPFKNVCAYAKINLPDMLDVIEALGIDEYVIGKSDFLQEIKSTIEEGAQELGYPLGGYNLATVIGLLEAAKKCVELGWYYDCFEENFDQFKYDYLTYKDITITAGNYEDSYYYNIICGNVDVVCNTNGEITLAGASGETIDDIQNSDNNNNYKEIKYYTKGYAGNHYIAVVPCPTDEDNDFALTELTIKVSTGNNTLSITRSIKNSDPSAPTFFITNFLVNKVVDMGSISEEGWHLAD